jgi:hypothetical protein
MDEVTKNYSYHVGYIDEDNQGDSSRAISILSPVSLRGFFNTKGFNFRVGCNKLLWLANRPNKPMRGLTDFSHSG